MFADSLNSNQLKQADMFVRVVKQERKAETHICIIDIIIEAESWQFYTRSLELCLGIRKPLYRKW